MDLREEAAMEKRGRSTTAGGHLGESVGKALTDSIDEPLDGLIKAEDHPPRALSSVPKGGICCAKQGILVITRTAFSYYSRPRK